MKRSQPTDGPRILVRGKGGASGDRELSRLRSRIRTGWRRVVSGVGGNMVSDWRHTYLVGHDAGRRTWVLSCADWGTLDRPRNTPKVMALAAAIESTETDENQIVQALLDAAQDWFSIDEVTEEGEFEVRLPGFR